MQSTIPTAKAALTSLFDAAVSAPIITGETVGVGQELTVVVGYQADDNPIAVDGGGLIANYGLTPAREQYTIYCAVAANYGSTDVPAAETAVFAVFTQLLGALAASPTLGVPGVMTATVDRFQLVESQAPDGLTVTLKFGVLVDAFTT